MTPRPDGVVLASLGTLLIRLACSNRMLLYVRPSTRPEVLACGIAMSLLGLVVLLADRRPAHAAKAATSWLMLIPAVVLVLVPAPRQGVQLAAAAPSVHAKPGALEPALHGPQPISLHVSDFVIRAQWDRPSLRGRQLKIIGFGERSHGRDLLARLSITCCAADAQEDDIALTGHSAGSVGLHQWVAVTGRFAGVSGWNPAVPVLAVDSVAPIATPSDPYD